MRFLISVIDDQTGTARPDEMAEIDAFNERLRAGGHWVFACGVAAPSTAVTIDNRDGTPVVTEGPFLTSPEYQSGFWIVEAADRETAIALATEGSRCCNRKVEVRALLGG